MENKYSPILQARIFKDNTRAVKTIFPHLKLIREQVLMQKRLK